MILMWLGSYALMLFGLTQCLAALEGLMSPLSRYFLLQKKGVGLSLTLASPRQSLFSAMALYNLRIISQSQAVLLMCLCNLGFWAVFLIGCLYLNFNGYFLLGIASVSFLASFLTEKLQPWLRLIFFLGLFLVGAEALLKNASVLQSLLGLSDGAFFLADGRLPAVLMLFALAALGGLIIRIEYWSLALGLSLLVTNVMSFNGALALFLGEQVANVLLLWYRSRRLNQVCCTLSWQWGLVSFIFLCGGFFFAAELRPYLGYQGKAFSYLLLTGVILGIQTLGLMFWGHFASRSKVDEMQDIRYIGSAWVKENLLPEPVKQWAQEQVQKRLSEIRYHLAGLGTLKEGQVPNNLQDRLRTEEKVLAEVLTTLD